MATRIVAEATKGIKQELRADGGDVSVGVAGPSRVSKAPAPAPGPAAHSDAIAYDSQGRILYLQPKDAPAYNPTPIEELKKMKREPQFSPAGSEDEQEQQRPFMPSGLSQIAKLNPPSTSSSALRRTVSKPPPTSIKNSGSCLLLPDISDDSDEEEGEGGGGKESVDVVGSILMKGMKSGVFNNVDEFQHELIKNKMKMKEKRLKKEQEKGATPTAAKPDKISCNTVSSSSEEVKEADGVKAAKIPAEEPEETEEAKKARLEREEAKRLVEQRERELVKLEEKRKMVEMFYKNRQLSIDSNNPSSKKKEDVAEEEEVTVLKEERWAKEPSQTIVISSDGGKRSSDDSSNSDSGDDHRRRRRRSRKHHRRGSRSSRRRSESDCGRRRHKKRRKRRRRRSRSSSSSSSLSSTSSRSSSSSSGGRSRRKKKKRKRRRSSRSGLEKEKKRRRADDEGEKFPPLAAVLAEVNRKPERLSAAAGSVPIKLEANENLKSVPLKGSDTGASVRMKSEPNDVKVKKEAPENTIKNLDEAEDDDELPETVKSFLDVMNELDEANKISSKKSIKKENHKSKDKSGDALPSKSKVKKEPSKKEKGEEKRSKSAGKVRHHRSSHGHKSPSHSSKKHSDISKHKSSSRKSKESTKVLSKSHKPEAEKPRSQAEDKAEKKKSGDTGGGSPLPDFSAELDMLPDELDDYGSGNPGVGNPDSDDNFFSDEDDEDDELRKIFDAYEPEPKVDDTAAQRKAQKLEAAAKAREAEAAAGAGTEIPGGPAKKRVARDGAEVRKTSAKHRPPPPVPKSKKLAPSQVLMQRYRSLQTRKEDDDLEAKLSEITEGASPKKRVAHARGLTGYMPDRAKSKLQRQLDSRREATESNPQEQTVGHTLKGMPRLAHTPTAKTLQRLEKPLIATDLSAKVSSVFVFVSELDPATPRCVKRLLNL